MIDSKILIIEIEIKLNSIMNKIKIMINIKIIIEQIIDKLIDNKIIIIIRSIMTKDNRTINKNNINKI